MVGGGRGRGGECWFGWRWVWSRSRIADLQSDMRCGGAGLGQGSVGKAVVTEEREVCKEDKFEKKRRGHTIRARVWRPYHSRLFIYLNIKIQLVNK